MYRVPEIVELLSRVVSGATSLEGKDALTFRTAAFHGLLTGHEILLSTGPEVTQVQVTSEGKKYLEIHSRHRP